MQNVSRHRPAYDVAAERAAPLRGLTPESAVLLRRARVRRWLLLTIAVVLLFSLVSQIAKYRYGFSSGLGLVTFFYVDEENNLPTWYQSIAYFVAALLLALIALPLWRKGAPFARHWAVLAAIFVFLSLDEVGSLHERSIEPLQRVIGMPGGWWTPTWVIPALILVVLLGIAYLRFFFHFSWRERGQLVLSAGLLVGGAIGIEMANAAIELGSHLERKETLTYSLMSHLEEALEMLGLVAFVDFLLGRLARGPAISIAASDST